MAQPYLGEIEAFAFNFAPRGWALCAGQVLPINQNTALFSLLGTTYGGNGTTTFQLPDLRGLLKFASRPDWMRVELRSSKSKAKSATRACAVRCGRQPESARQ